MEKRTMVFDFDGPIADSFLIAYEIAKMIRPTLSVESYRDKWKVNIAKAVFTEPAIDRPLDFHKEYSARMKELYLDPAKKQVIIQIASRFNLHISSSTLTGTLEEFCERNGIRSFFKEVLGYDFEKSKVKKFHFLFEKYSLDPSDVIFITDTIGDIEEAREVGIKTIVAVADGYQDRKVLETAQPSIVLESLKDLPGWLQI